MRRIRLEPLDHTESRLDTLVAKAVCNAPNADSVRDQIAAVVEGQIGLYQRTGAQAPWIGYLARDENTGELLGSCSFIGHPTAGSVEIAYFTFPSFEGTGVATAMASELIAIAGTAGNPGLHAFTLPMENASSCILRKLGFTHAGEATDDEAGLVWKWERKSTPMP